MRSSSGSSPVSNLSYCFKYIFIGRQKHARACHGAGPTKPGTVAVLRPPIRGNFVRIRHRLLGTAFGRAAGWFRMAPRTKTAQLFRPRRPRRHSYGRASFIAWRVARDETISSTVEDRNRNTVPLSLACPAAPGRSHGREMRATGHPICFENRAKFSFRHRYNRRFPSVLTPPGDTQAASHRWRRKRIGYATFALSHRCRRCWPSPSRTDRLVPWVAAAGCGEALARINGKICSRFAGSFRAGDETVPNASAWMPARPRPRPRHVAKERRPPSTEEANDISWEGKWCRLGDLNTRPSHYECDALPAELRRRRFLKPCGFRPL
jgi:hypothetical protein